MASVDFSSFIDWAGVFARGFGIPVRTAFGATSCVAKSHTLGIGNPLHSEPHLDVYAMNVFKKIAVWITDRIRNDSSSVVVIPGSAGPSSDPSGQNAQEPRDLTSGHRQSRSFVYRQVGPNEIVSESVESWDRYGNVMEGDSVELRVVTASLHLSTPENLKCICSQCGKAEDTVILSAVSQHTLCRACARSFTLPSGEIIHVTPDEHVALSWDYDTWAAFDNQQGRRQS